MTRRDAGYSKSHFQAIRIRDDVASSAISCLASRRCCSVSFFRIFFVGASFFSVTRSDAIRLRCSRTCSPALLCQKKNTNRLWTTRSARFTAESVSRSHFGSSAAVTTQGHPYWLSSPSSSVDSAVGIVGVSTLAPQRSVNVSGLACGLARGSLGSVDEWWVRVHVARRKGIREFLRRSAGTGKRPDPPRRRRLKSCQQDHAISRDS